MKYALITHDKFKFILEEGEYGAFISALQNNNKIFVIKKYKAVIPLHITPTVLPFEMWYAQENQRLALTHHRLCKKCLCIMAIEDKCSCWGEMGKEEKKNAFTQELPESVKKTIAEIAKEKSFPELKNIDKSEIEYVESKKNKTQYAEDGGWVDEDGVTHYE